MFTFVYNLKTNDYRLHVNALFFFPENRVLAPVILVRTVPRVWPSTKMAIICARVLLDTLENTVKRVFKHIP